MNLLEASVPEREGLRYRALVFLAKSHCIANPIAHLGRNVSPLWWLHSFREWFDVVFAE